MMEFTLVNFIIRINSQSATICSFVEPFLTTYSTESSGFGNDEIHSDKMIFSIWNVGEAMSMEEVTNEQAYDANKIKILEGLDAVRKRPRRYIGSTSAKELHHLVWKITDISMNK